MQDKIDDLARRREEAYHAGSPMAVERQHSKGKMLARERIDYFCDPGSFHELDLLARHRAHAAGLEERPYTDGVITGWGTVEGRRVFVFSQDFTVFGGALGEVFAEKIHKVMDFALKVGAPVVGLNDGAGARIQEGVASLASYGGIFYRNVLASGVVPQISVILGPCAGGASRRRGSPFEPAARRRRRSPRRVARRPSTADRCPCRGARRRERRAHRKRRRDRPRRALTRPASCRSFVTLAFPTRDGLIGTVHSCPRFPSVSPGGGCLPSR